MKITQILKEDLTWSDVQAKYSGNTVLLQLIMKAGQEPRNQIDGKTDWGSAIDLGAAEYQKLMTDQANKRANSNKPVKEPVDKTDTEKKSRGAQFGNQNALKGGAERIPGLRDLQKIDTKSFGSSATSSFAFGQALSDIGGNKLDYAKKGLRLAASKKNPNNKL